MPLSNEEKARIAEEETVRSQARLDYALNPATKAARGFSIWYKLVTVVWVILALVAIGFAVLHR